MFELMHSISIDAQAGIATGHARVAQDHAMLLDHFPGAPLLPGSWLIELSAQVAGPLAEESIRLRHGLERWALLGMIKNAKFLSPAPLPASLRLAAALKRMEPSSAVVAVRAFHEDELHLKAELVMILLEVSPEWHDAVEERHRRLAEWRSAKP